MEKFWYSIFIAVLIHGNLGMAEVTLSNHTCETQALKKVVIDDYCTFKVYLKSAIMLVPTIHEYKLLPSCLNCSVTIVTKPELQLVATVALLGTEIADDGKCDMNKLDFYDGESTDGASRLSGKDGICGCTLPPNGSFKSTNNTMTVHFQTKCDYIQHGKLEVVVTAITNDMYNVTECHGEFECGSGECIDKNLVCDGENNCRDQSDETNCHIRNGTCPGKFECQDGRCVDKNLVCNGHKNCPDGSDEANCQRNSSCPGQFECKNGDCIDKNKVCNGKNDCADKSDEIDCHTKLSLVLLYVLLGVAGLIAVLLIVVIIILCCRHCCLSFKIASAYRRLS